MYSATAGSVRRPAAATIPTDASIDVAGHATGAVSANAWTGFTSPASTVFTSTNWTSPSTSIKYLKADSSKDFIAKSTGSCRDVEVTTWARRGIVYLRLTDAGKALYFDHNGETANGNLEVGIVTGLTEGVAEPKSNGTFTLLYATSNLAGVAAGYSVTDTAGDTFTFGVSGFDIYVKFNGTEFARFKTIKHWQSGKVGFQSANGYGHRDISVDFKSEAALYSYLPNSLIDLRDFGLKSLSATGTIPSSSQTLTLVSNPGFAIGDKIIIAVGHEPGAGALGTVGVGNVWPDLSYADDATMEADHSQPAGSFAWLEDSGKVRRYRFTAGEGNIWYPWFPELYYYNMAVPLGKRATITNVVGNVLTLDTSSNAGSTGANVYYDNTDVFAAVCSDTNLTEMPEDVTVRIPAGSYAGVYTQDVYQRQGWTIQGAGKEATTLFSPDGVTTIKLRLNQCQDSKIKDLRVLGNARPTGFSLYYATPNVLTEADIAGIDMYTSTDCEVMDCKGTDHFTKAVGASNFASNCWAYRCDSVLTTEHRRYTQWQLMWSDCLTGGTRDCTIDSPYLVAGCNAFRSTGVSHINVVSRNGTCASNGSSDTLYDSPHITIEDGSQYNELSYSHQNPIFDINSNIGESDGGIIIRNPHVVQEGHINAGGDILVNVAVNANQPDCLIEGTIEDDESPGGYFESPDWTLPSSGNSFGAIGVRNSGTGTVVRGIRFKGQSNYSGGVGNIHTEAGSAAIENCVMDHAATGSYVTSETGTQTNAAWELAHP